MPRVPTIAPGETVTWSNDDGAPHAIAFKDGAAGSETLFAGKTFSRTFEKAGSWDYYCGIHNYVTGQIIVGPKQRHIRLIFTWTANAREVPRIKSLASIGVY